LRITQSVKHGGRHSFVLRNCTYRMRLPGRKKIQKGTAPGGRGLDQTKGKNIPHKVANAEKQDPKGGKGVAPKKKKNLKETKESNWNVNGIRNVVSSSGESDERQKVGGLSEI